MSFLKKFFGTTAGMDATTTKVQQLINDNKVVLFTKSWCGYCRSSKQTLDRLGADYVFFDLDRMEDGDTMQDALEELTGQSTVPNTFINKKHIGGNSDLQDLFRRGQLEPLLKSVEAIKP